MISATVSTATFLANNAKEARRLAQTHKHQTPEIKKAGMVATDVRLANSPNFYTGSWSANNGTPYQKAVAIGYVLLKTLPEFTNKEWEDA